MEELKLIYGGEVTVETVLALHDVGFEFVIEDGRIANMIFFGEVI